MNEQPKRSPAEPPSRVEGFVPQPKRSAGFPRAFVLHLLETAEEGGPVLRGRVEEVSSGRRVSFVSGRELFEFLTRSLLTPEDPDSGGDR